MQTDAQQIHCYPQAHTISEGEIRPVMLDARALLLIRQQGRLYCVDDRCGHFGVPLRGGTLEEGVIRCPMHGITFSLSDGSVVNRPWENCSPLVIHAVSEQRGVATIQLAREQQPDCGNPRAE
jgi:nitrite reductase/ring-hydroxylating ferredoxin subunit